MSMTIDMSFNFQKFLRNHVIYGFSPQMFVLNNWAIYIPSNYNSIIDAAMQLFFR